jgi:hypothetical protein
LQTVWGTIATMRMLACCGLVNPARKALPGSGLSLAACQHCQRALEVVVKG